MASNPPGSWPVIDRPLSSSANDEADLVAEALFNSRFDRGGIEDRTSESTGKGKGKERAGKTHGHSILPAEILETYVCLRDLSRPFHLVGADAEPSTEFSTLPTRRPSLP